ncbi:MAG TPA: IPT/TIG domain-containing protein [Bryobacteraceae bacterium]|nr:IPT/TIG domain-containing protein [Bryobacteraceae bacterium]
MRISALSIPLLIALALPVHPQSEGGLPMMASIEPDSGKIGDVLVVQGANLGRTSVSALYLTDGNKDVKVAILEQTPTSIKFRIPPEAKPGRVALMVLTAGKEPKLIEEPVKLTVESATTS